MKLKLHKLTRQELILYCESLDEIADLALHDLEKIGKICKKKTGETVIEAVKRLKKRKKI